MSHQTESIEDVDGAPIDAAALDLDGAPLDTAALGADLDGKPLHDDDAINEDVDGEPSKLPSVALNMDVNVECSDMP